MRILQVHNRYQMVGGEDVVVTAERSTLEACGHEVAVVEADNAEIGGALRQATLGLSAVYSAKARRKVAEILAHFKPDVMHVHNFFPQFSPSIYYAAREAGIAVVQTLHNYRLLCPSATFLRDGHICEDCLGRIVPLPGLLHGCYRSSRIATAPVVSMLALHRVIGTWSTMVDAYIALTDFGREKFIQGGLPAERIFVKPNFVSPAPTMGPSDGGYALFLGRISEEKGIETLLKAWEKLSGRLPLRIAGEGPMLDKVTAAAECMSEISVLGRVRRREVDELLNGAHALIVPSICYETFGMVVIEAFAAGVPVIAADIGALAKLVEHRRTGLQFRAGDADDLIVQLEWLWKNETARQAIRKTARAEFELRYTAHRNCTMLLAIYESARRRNQSRAT